MQALFQQISMPPHRKSTIDTSLISFYNTKDVVVWQGIRNLNSDSYMIVGSTKTTGILYIGTLDGFSQSVYPIVMPSSTIISTNVYGISNLFNGLIRLVGSYKKNDTTNTNTNSTSNSTSSVVYGFYFEGTPDQLVSRTNYKTLKMGSKYNYLHSTMGDLLVGNIDNPLQYGQHGLQYGPTNGFIYDFINESKEFIVYPGALTTTAYGIWHNGGSSYTICGGYSKFAVSITNIYISESGTQVPVPIGEGYLVNYDSVTHLFTDWTTLSYPTSKYVTHFQGISSSKHGQYELVANSMETNGSTKGSWVKVIYRHNHFRVTSWIDITYPPTKTPNLGISCNSVAGSSIVGVVLGPTNIPYQAKILI